MKEDSHVAGGSQGLGAQLQRVALYTTEKGEEILKAHSRMTAGCGASSSEWPDTGAGGRWEDQPNPKQKHRR